MARQERNSVDYFPHTVTHGRKMFYLRSKYKNDGYAVWFMLIEQLGRTEYHYLDLSDDIQLMYLSSEFMVSEQVLKDIIDILVKFGDFDDDLWNNHKVIFNEKFNQSISDAYKKRNNDCISKENLYKLLGFPNESKKTPNKPLSTSEVSGSTQRKEKDIKEDNIYRFFDHLSITVEEVESLKSKGYTQIQIDDILDAIENSKKNKNYKSLPKTALIWLKRNGEPAQQNDKPLNPHDAILKTFNQR